MAKNKGWRPTKMTDDLVRKLEEIFKIDWTVWEACSRAWIWTTTYYERIEKDKNFADNMKRAQDYPFILARKTLMKGMQEGDNKSAIEYLKRRDKRYRDKSENINTNINKNPLLDRLKDVQDTGTAGDK